MPCSLGGKKCQGKSTPVQMANLGTLCAECRAPIVAHLNGGKPPSRSDFICEYT